MTGMRVSSPPSRARTAEPRRGGGARTRYRTSGTAGRRITDRSRSARIESVSVRGNAPAGCAGEVAPALHDRGAGV